MGNQNQNCPALKVHGNLMKHSGQETYLGDIINQNNKIKVNIESRKAKGYGKVAIINEVPLGHWRVDAGLQLQQAMLINGTLFNAWHNVREDDLIILETVDESLLRGIMGAHSKIPIEALYLETACLQIRFIVASRRLSYLYNILQKGAGKMVRKVYELQKEKTSHGDFFQLISQDMQK